MIVRRMSPLAQTPEGVLQVIDKIRTCRRVTGWGDSRTIEQLFNPNAYIWLIDDVGLVGVFPLSNELAHIHIFFWDRRLRGREPVGRAVIHWISQNTPIKTLMTGIGEEFRATIAYAQRCGFRPVKVEAGRVVMVLQL